MHPSEQSVIEAAAMQVSANTASYVSYTQVHTSVLLTADVEMFFQTSHS